VLFHEYFDGDTGRGVGASHQTGWSGLVAKLLQPRRTEADAERELVDALVGATSLDRSNASSETFQRHAASK
jgi:hypothetical protein